MTYLRWSRIILACGIVGSVVMLTGLGSVLAADTSAKPAERTVTIDALRTPVIDAIDTLFRNSGYKYVIQPGVSGKITMTLNKVPFSEALRALVDGADVKAVLKDGTYTISPKPKPAEVTPAGTEGRGPSQPEDATTGATDGNIPADNTTGTENGPVFYGSQSPYGFVEEPQYYEVAPGVRMYNYIPFGTPLIMPSPVGVPPATPPPGLRSSSVQNLLDRFSAIHSMPWFNPGVGLGGPPRMGVAPGGSPGRLY